MEAKSPICHKRVLAWCKTFQPAVEIKYFNQLEYSPKEPSSHKHHCTSIDICSSKINKENINPEQVTKHTNFQSENKMLKDQLDTQSKHEDKMQNMKMQF